MTQRNMRSLLALVLGVVSLGTQDRAPVPVDDPEAYAVYASVLHGEWPVRVARAKTLVFQRESVTNRTCMPSGKPLEVEWRPVLESFWVENTGTRTIRAGFNLGISYVVVPSVEIQSALRSGADALNFGWDGFYKRYPDSGGFLTVSAVGFDRLKQRAMVYMAHSCGSLCGGGTHHLLEKVEGVWREAHVAGLSQCAWVS